MDRSTRRTILRRGALLASAGVGGCLGGRPGTDAGRDGSPTPGTDESTASSPAAGAGTTSGAGATTGDGTAGKEETTSTRTTQSNVAWRFDLGASIDVEPTVAGDTVYVGGWRQTQGTPTPGGDGADSDPSASLVALSLADGSERWRVDLGAPVQARPRVSGDRVYVVRGFDGLHGHGYQVRAVSADGRELWRHETESLKFLSVLGADESGPVVGTQDDNLERGNERVTALAADGAVGWQRELGDVDGGAVAGDAVYATDYVGRLRAYDRGGGTVRWTVERDSRYLRGPVVTDAGVLTAGESVLSVDPGDGRVQWAVDDVAPVAFVVDAGRVFVSTEGGRAVALDAADGSDVWSADVGSEAPGVAVEGEACYLARPDGTLAARASESGDRLWSTEFDGCVGVAAAGDRVYALNRDEVVVLAATDGRPLEAVTVAGTPVGLVSGDAVTVLATDAGHVYGIAL